MSLKRQRSTENDSLNDFITSQKSTSTDLNRWTKKPYTQGYYDILETRKLLPVYQKKAEIVDAVSRNPVTLLVGETGSGKTTQVPQFLAELPQFRGYVACTQPRRLAAISVASRISQEMDVELGKEVGYHVRFQSKYSPIETKVLFLTDGMLVREFFSDAKVSSFSVIIVDEAHERTMDTDVVLGLLKQLLVKRPDFRIVVMSATLDVEKITNFFPGAPLIHVSGRKYNVDVFYLPTPVSNYATAAVSCVLQIHEKEPPGDILCFLTGEAEIENAVKSTSEKLEKNIDKMGGKVSVLPLYSSLSFEQQQKIFERSQADTRKIIFATNIAETSVTIDGIVYVVDCGYQKQSLFSADGRIDYLLPSIISKASAEQRRGRAGRTREGKCYRLFTETEFKEFPDQTHPEILRSNMVNVLLMLLNVGVANPHDFPFIDCPSDKNLEEAFYELLMIGAVDEELQITPYGKQLANFPVDICSARMILSSSSHGCAGDVAVLAAMLEVGTVFVRPHGKVSEADQCHAKQCHPSEGDHIGLIRVFHGYYEHQREGARYCYENFLRHQGLMQAVQIYGQLRQLMTKFKVNVISTYDSASTSLNSVALRKSIVDGFSMQVAFFSKERDSYITVRDGKKVTPHRQSVLSKLRPFPLWIVYDRLEVQGENGIFFRVASQVQVEWLIEASSFFRDPSEIHDAEIALALRKASGA